MRASSVPCCDCCNATNTSFVRDRLPTLRHLGQDHAWDHYLARVYGELPSYPVALSSFGWFYHHGLPITVEPAWFAPRCASLPGVAWTGTAGCGFGGRGLPESQPPLREAGFFVQRYDRKRPEAFAEARGFANDTWVEVMRTFMDRKSTESSGSWYWHAKGSGVWLNLGRTLVEHDVAARGERHYFFEHGGTRARHLALMGFDSVQFPVLAGSRTFIGKPVENNRFEIVALHRYRGPGVSGTCADSYRGGWAHGRPCNCSTKLDRSGKDSGVVNCGGAPRGHGRGP